MNAPQTHPADIRKILFATDLSARSDRALERALQLAQQHSSRLVIVHAFEPPRNLERGDLPPTWRRPPDAVETMKRRIAQALRAELGAAVDTAKLVIEDGKSGEVVERVAKEEQVDLIVTGVAREGLFDMEPAVLGQTVEHLLRHVETPVLVVVNRPQGGYRHVAVTTDFSPSSGHALQVALRFFPGQTLYLLHASEAPYATLATDPVRHAEKFVEAHNTEAEAFLASVFMPDEDRRRVVPVVEPGPPAKLVREYVQTQNCDLVVMGTKGRNVVLEVLLGSVAKNILAQLPCDALVVRGPR